MPRLDLDLLVRQYSNFFTLRSRDRVVGISIEQLETMLVVRQDNMQYEFFGTSQWRERSATGIESVFEIQGDRTFIAVPLKKEVIHAAYETVENAIRFLEMYLAMSNHPEIPTGLGYTLTEVQARQILRMLKRVQGDKERFTNSDTAKEYENMVRGLPRELCIFGCHGEFRQKHEGLFIYSFRSFKAYDPNDVYYIFKPRIQVKWIGRNRYLIEGQIMTDDAQGIRLSQQINDPREIGSSLAKFSDELRSKFRAYQTWHDLKLHL